MVTVNRVRKYLIVVLICMSLIFSKVDIFACDSFKGCELNLISWNWPPECLPCFEFFFSDTQDISWKRVFVTYSPLILVHIECPAALPFMVKLKGACSTKEQPCFMFHCSFPLCNFLVIYVGILLISDVFVSVVQIHDSVMHRCLFILFGFIFMYDYGVFINFPMLFSSYFLIIYFIYFTVYMLIPNS